MPSGNSLVLIYGTPPEACGTVQVLLQAGVDPREISVIGRPGPFVGTKAEDCDKSLVTARNGRPAFWKEMSTLLGECAPHELPDLGTLLIAGPMAGWMTAALDNAPIFGGLNALAAVLHSLGVTRETIHKGEAALKENSYLVVVHGPAREVARAQEIVQDPGDSRPLR